MSLFHRKAKPNAICPYCLTITGLEPGQQVTCGFCESELMRAMNFFVPLQDFLNQHSLTEMKEWLITANVHLKNAKTKNDRFYTKDYLLGVNRVIKLKEKNNTQ